jgi:signal transduction histidine kinase
MISFRSLSIPKKIVAITMIISGAALFLASAALLAYDFSNARRQLEESATVFARTAADNATSAVLFSDVSTSTDALNSLRAEPSILAGCIYKDGRLFAQYIAKGVAPCAEELDLDANDPSIVLVSTPIQWNGKDIGIVQLRASLRDAYTHLRIEGLTIGIILIIAALFALALSSRLHAFISKPILDLASTAHEVSRRKDYSIRANTQNADEIGMLVEAFNEMLGQIQKRDRDLQQRTAELVEANRMKDQFLATLSHELRTPLNSILGWAVLVQEGQLPPGRDKAALQAIERNARMQARLIEDLLDVSRIISGKFAVDSSIVILDQIIENAIEVMRPAADAKKIRVEFDKTADRVTVAGDAARLQQVVWNLLSNAVKFTGEHGAVIVHLEKSAQYAHISVADNGIGISPEFLPYVFDRFRQADGSSTRRHGGLGLGLAIVRHIVEVHGGAVRVESRGRGAGTTFKIDLPLIVSSEQEKKFRMRIEK